MNMQSLEQQLYDVYGVDYIPWWRTLPFYLACGICVSILLMIIFYRMLRWYSARYRCKTPWDKALHALDALNNHLHVEQSRLFYSTLTAILKTYLHERYGYYVADKTDEECIAFLGATEFPPALQEPVQKVVRASVMSKFASHHVVLLDQMREHRLLLRDFIIATIPRRTE